MKTKAIWVLFLILGLLFGGVAAAQAGGWAVLTLEEMPEAITANEPFTVRFAVRQHGQTLMSGLKPEITAVHLPTGERLTIEAQETADKRYTAALTLPHAGDWQWEIDAFGLHLLPPLTVAAPLPAPAPRLPDSAAVGLLSLSVAAGLGTAVALIAWTRQRTRRRLGLAVGLLVLGGLCLAGWLWATTPVVAQSEPVSAITAVSPGEALFFAKGCVSCHQHNGLTLPVAFKSDFGPNLSAYKGSPEYLRLWLSDPASVKPETFMPNLSLTDGEIETLIQFLTAYKSANGLSTDV